jgi:GNAT superfamily N-acetyltransferase
MPTHPFAVRNAAPSDLDAIVATLTTAFFNDPVWGPTFPQVDRRAAQASALWRLFAASSLRYSWTLVTQHVESAAVWIPPGGDELTDDEVNGLEEFLLENSDRKIADTILAMFELFDQARPAEPHFYLSLLATHDDYRGSGLGLRLLNESLSRIDSLGMPAYLESSNPVNNGKYQSAGFSRRDDLTMPSGQIVTTMWRPARQ